MVLALEVFKVWVLKSIREMIEVAMGWVLILAILFLCAAGSMVVPVLVCLALIRCITGG